MLTLENFEEASEIVKKVTQETKLIKSSYFSELTGNRVFLKPENMQRTGAYKAVSYTHLDVYKRQVSKSSCGCHGRRQCT